MQLKTGHKSVHTAKTVILFLRSKMRNMSQAVRDVFQKWIDGNEIVEAIIQKCGSIYDMVKEQLVYEEDNENDHAYNLDADVPFHDFSKPLLDENFYIQHYMKSFLPVSVDLERLFSLCRHSRNYLQCRMTVEKHSRNLFFRGQGHFVTIHLGDNMASVTWATKVSTKWVDQIDQLTDIFEEVSIFVVRLGRFAPFAK